MIGALQTLSMTTTSSLVAAFNSNRWSITFFPPLVDSYTVATSGDVASGLGLGINMVAGATPVTISKESHGSLATSAWYGVANAGTVNAAIAESLGSY